MKGTIYAGGCVRAFAIETKKEDDVQNEMRWSPLHRAHFGDSGVGQRAMCP